VEPALFRQCLAYAIERYPQDRASYHVSAELSRVPQPDTPDEAALPALLDQFDARQVLHVTFGSVLMRFGQELRRVLAAREEAHYAALEAHFLKHFAPFSG